MSARTLPPEIGPAMRRMKAIAAKSADSLILADGPPQPDWRLLDMCGDALHYVTVANQAYAAREPGFWQSPDQNDKAKEAAFRQRDADLMAEYYRNNHAAVQILRAAKKIKATTPAGIYAKALLVRCSRTGAQELAMSLAADLVECEPLRAVLWPVGEVTA